jgi:hypothetical protein
MEDSLKYSGDIRIDRGYRTFVGKTGDGARSVSADSRQLAEVSRIFWKHSPVIPHDLLSQPMQVGGPAIIAEPLPALSDREYPSGGQSVDIGIRVQEAVIVGLDPRHLGLLEHELGDQDPIRIASSAPREVPPVLAKPAEQGAPKCWEMGQGDAGACARGVGHDSEESSTEGCVRVTGRDIVPRQDRNPVSLERRS